MCEEKELRDECQKKRKKERKKERKKDEASAIEAAFEDKHGEVTCTKSEKVAGEITEK